MNFEFSETQKDLKAQARRYLEAECPSSRVRAVLEGADDHDHKLWKGLADLGFLAAVIPEAYGGLGLGYLELCVIAEELGRALAPVPFSSSTVLATEFLLRAGTEAQKKRWLPKLGSGEAIGTFALAERTGFVADSSLRTVVENGMATGEKRPAPDGRAADFAIVAARTGSAGPVSLYIVEMAGPGVSREALATIDPSRSHAQLTLEGAPAEPLGATGEGWRLIQDVYDRAAVITAFEQIGGADRALEMARDYALDRMAFGRPIGSFQAIKHMLADMYVSATLARSNGYYGAWALSTESSQLPIAAATARISATQAFQHCAKNNNQVHGGMGFTWAFDCHLFYRRSNLLALGLGPLSHWESVLIDRMRAQNAA